MRQYHGHGRRSGEGGAEKEDKDTLVMVVVARIKSTIAEAQRTQIVLG